MSEYRDRIATLARRSQRDCAEFTAPANPPAEDRALSYLREGVADVVSLYVEARTGELVAFEEVEFSLLQRAMNDWLELYAACYGTDITAEFTVREAAELVIATHNLRDTAQLLTRVPARDTSRSWSQGTVK